MKKTQLSKNSRGNNDRISDKNSVTQMDDGKLDNVQLSGRESSIPIDIVDGAHQSISVRKPDEEEEKSVTTLSRLSSRDELEIRDDDPTRTRKIRGWLNRLSEKNLELIYEELEKLYYEGRRHEVIGIITRVILETCSDTLIMLEIFMKLYAAFIALMYHIIGIETGNN